MGEPRHRLRLTRAMRLRRGCEFARLKTAGLRAVAGCLVLNWIPLPPGQGHRLGVITSRKVGSAVARSRARRLIREAFRLNQPSLSCPLMLVLVARPSIARRGFSEVQHDLQFLLRRAGLFADGSSTPPPEAVFPSPSGMT